MTAPDFPPGVLEKAARALSPVVPNSGGVLWEHTHEDGQVQPVTLDEAARAVLAAVAGNLRAEGARQVLAAVEGVGDVHDSYPWVLRAAREALARIEKGAGA